MTFAELTQSKGWKQFMAKLYGIGAAVVIIGALFKIMHWPGAGPMLIVGLSTEAVIFFISAFEPLHEEDDWSLVFPQLSGLGDDDEIEVTGPVPTAAVEDPKFKQEQLELNKQMLEQIKQLRPHGEASAIEKFDKLVSDNKLGPELFTKLSKGLHSLSDTTTNMKDLASATVATGEFVGNMKNASKSLTDFATSNNSAATTIKESTTAVVKGSKDLSSSYQMLIDSMSIDFSHVAKSNTNYSSQLENLNKNLSALNAVYELQLQSTNESLQKSQEFYGALNKMMGGMEGASKQADVYRSEVDKLSKKIVALNDVYGKMLAAMNVKLD